MPKVSRYSWRKWMGCLLLLFTGFLARAQFRLRLEPVDKDTAFLTQTLGIQTSFTGLLACRQYIDKLPELLESKGYSTASIDSLWIDSAYCFVKLYVGEAYKLAYI